MEEISWQIWSLDLRVTVTALRGQGCKCWEGEEKEGRDEVKSYRKKETGSC